MSTLELPRERSAPEKARRAIEGLVRAHLAPDEQAAAHLLISELVSNAVVHGDGRIELWHGLVGDRVRFEVADEGRRELTRLDSLDGPNLDTGHGFGLHLVDELSSRWGFYEGSSHVWFELPARSA